MNSQGYLESFGWKQGEALKKGGIKKPILVKHKKDKKGIGHEVNGSADAWWERLFDGQLKGLDVNNDSDKGISFKQDKVVASAVRKQDSPLYRMFVRGETLQGTTGKVVLTVAENGSSSVIESFKTSFNDGSKTTDEKGSIPKDKSSKKEKKKSDDKKKSKGKKSTKESKDVKEKDEKKKESKSKSEKSKTDGALSTVEQISKKESKEKKEKKDKKDKKKIKENGEEGKKDKKSKKEKSKTGEESKENKSKKRKLDEDDSRSKSKKSKA